MQREQSMKMSLCNTCRIIVVSFVVLSNIDALAVAFTLRHTTLGVYPNQDLVAEENVIQEARRDLNGQNDVQLTLNKTINITKSFTDNVSINGTVEPAHNFEPYLYQRTNVTPPQTITSQEPTYEEIGSERAITNTELQAITTNSIFEDDTTPIRFDFDNIPKIETTTEFFTIDKENTFKLNNNFSTPNKISNVKSDANMNNAENELSRSKFRDTLTIDKIKGQKPVTMPSYKLRLIPKWKKYTTIERKRPSLLTDEKMRKSNKEEEIINAESKHLQVSLQDTVTSDIPSLEQLKNDLITSTVKFKWSESSSDIQLKSLDIQENLTASSNVTPSMNFTSTDVVLLNSTVESIRAGFLDFSGKTTTVKPTTEKGTSDFKSINNELLRSMFETENPEIDALEDKTGNKIKSQSMLNEDALKEELLKEELINDREEKNAHRYSEDYDNNKFANTEISNTDLDNSTQLDSSLSDNLNVKPISVDKSKNTTLYAVNPNYKPMKKIEVLPPKQFVRDPDDNSWRNESLSSLGIVFKPKNSSKPFTQVLKNKTETEWNNFSDKDSKNDLPDLKERLQKMAEKRKSKRKKIDSFGNIVYFDYEENSNSAESTSHPTEKLSASVNASSPDLQDTYQARSNSSTEELQDVTKTTPSLTTLTSTTENVKQNLSSTKKPKKFFNVPEYYDTTDEDDTDYLSMAKIDLKKFTTSLRPSTPFLPGIIVANQPEWLVNKKLPLTNERKATIQYFPPLTTQKVNINDYDDDFKLRYGPSTTATELPKVLPASLDRTTTPMIENKLHYDKIHKDIESNYALANKPDYTKDFMFTQQPLTTDPGIAFINGDGSFDRGTYVIKHYKDFINAAAKDSEYEKNIEYIPYTEAPAELATKTYLNGYEKDKDRINVDNTYDYENQFRKDILQRFVDNFNQNSNKYKSDFPVIFNNSIIHRDTPYGRDVASSRAFMRGLYDSHKPKVASLKKPCEPNCESITVELSPAYELHYYVPEQEEKEEAVPQPVTLPYRYQL